MRKKKTVLALVVVLLLTLLVWWKGEKESLLIDENQLLRQERGKGSYEAELILEIEGETTTEMIITVPEQLFGEEEEALCLQEAIEEIEREFAGGNSSLEEVRTKVVICENYCQGMVQAGWEFSNPGLIAADGSLLEEEMISDKERVNAKVYLSCEDSSLIYEFDFYVCKQEKSGEEIFYEKLKQSISEDGKREGEKMLWLPLEQDGYKLVWKNQQSDLPLQVFLIGMLVVMLLPALEKEKEKEVQRRRDEQLIREYPALVSKLSLLLGAGMTLRKAWNLIVNRQTSSGIVYKEMLVTQREIENGKSEVEAYERFAERCGLQKYRKLMNYLIQNTRKGNKGLCQWLQTEAEEAFAERKSMALKLGEEVGTKLLLPMMMMLGIVVLVVMIPAVISFRAGVN